jgi:hypothetical protein
MKHEMKKDRPNDNLFKGGGVSHSGLSIYILKVT